MSWRTPAEQIEYEQRMAQLAPPDQAILHAASLKLLREFRQVIDLEAREILRDTLDAMEQDDRVALLDLARDAASVADQLCRLALKYEDPEILARAAHSRRQLEEIRGLVAGAGL